MGLGGLLVGGLLVGGLLCLGCSEAARPSATPLDAALIERMTREAKSGLEALALRGSPLARFTVGAVVADGGEHVDLVDDFDFHTRFYSFGFRADLVFPAALEVRGREAIERRIGDTDWTVDESMRDLDLVELLGEGTQAAGPRQVAGAAVFIDLEPGYGFDHVGGRRP